MANLKNMFGYDDNWKERDYSDNWVFKSKGKEHSNYRVVIDEAYPLSDLEKLKKLASGQKVIYELKIPNDVHAFAKVIKVIANDNAVIVFFADGDKNVMKLAKGEKYDIETAVAYAIAQKVYGSNSAFKKSVAKVLVDCRTNSSVIKDKTTPDVEEKIVKTLLNEEKFKVKKNTVDNRGRNPCMKCTVTDEGIKNNPSLATLQGLVLDINKKLKDKDRTVIVYRNGVRYELTRGEYKLYHGDKGWNAGDRSKGYGTNKGRTN